VKKIELYVLAFNNSKIIKDLLDKIKDSTIIDLPIVINIIDNGSTDDTEKIVQSFDFVKYYKLSSNIYFTGGANYCLSLSSAEHVFFMNSDVIPNKNAFVEIIKMAEKNEQLGIIGCKSRLMNGELQDVIKMYPSRIEIHALHGCISGVNFLKKFFLNKYSKTNSDNINDSIVEVVQDSFIYIRGKLISQGLRYDTNVRLYYTEDNICEEVRKMNYLVGFCNSAEVLHYSGATADQKKKSIRDIYDADAVEFVRRKNGYISSFILNCDIMIRSLLSKIKKSFS
jgi:GT2 family glycosyltransferase